MIEKLGRSKSWQFLLIIALILIVPLTVDINRRISVLRRMHQEEARLTQELTEAQSEQSELQAQLEYVNSDAYVEAWARVEARMTLPGETAFVPLIDWEVETDQTLPSGAAAGSNLSIPQQWRRLFLGDATP